MRNVFVILLMGILLVVTACSFDSNNSSQESFQQEENVILHANEVEVLPENYVSLDELHEKYRDILHIGFFESCIYAQDLDGIVLWQTTLDNPDEVLYYQETHYIHSEIVEKIVAAATHTSELRNKDYTLGDAVELPCSSYNCRAYYITIVSVQIAARENDVTTYVIFYSTEGYSGGQYAPELFDRVETTDGCSYNEFFAASTGSISIQVPADQTVCRVYVRGDGVDSIRIIEWRN